MKPTEQPLPETFEAAIAGIDSPAREAALQNILRGLHGVVATGITSGSVWISFRPDLTQREEICHLLHEKGFPPQLTLLNGQPIECQP